MCIISNHALSEISLQSPDLVQHSSLLALVLKLWTVQLYGWYENRKIRYYCIPSPISMVSSVSGSLPSLLLFDDFLKLFSSFNWIQHKHLHANLSSYSMLTFSWLWLTFLQFILLFLLPLFLFSFLFKQLFLLFSFFLLYNLNTLWTSQYSSR